MTIVTLAIIHIFFYQFQIENRFRNGDSMFFASLGKVESEHHLTKLNFFKYNCNNNDFSDVYYYSFNSAKCYLIDIEIPHVRH